MRLVRRSFFEMILSKEFFRLNLFHRCAPYRLGDRPLLPEPAEPVCIANIEPPVHKDQSAPTNHGIEHQPSIARRHKQDIEHHPYGIDYSINQHVNAKKRLLIFNMGFAEYLEILIHISCHWRTHPCKNHCLNCCETN